MKHAYVAIALLCCISALSCSSDDGGTQTPLPLIRLDAVETRPVSLSFTITCSQAEQVAYALQLAGDAVPAASELLAGGTQTEPGDTAPIVLTGLKEQTDYTVVAAARNGDLLSEVQVLRMSTRPFDVLVEGTRGIGGYYANELTGGRNGHYSLNISDIVWENDEAASAGYQFMLSFHSDLAADADRAEPAPGTYTVDATSSYGKFSIDTRFSKWNATDDSGANAGSGTFTSGTLTLEKEQDGSYRATACLMTSAEQYCKATWTSSINWINNTTPAFADQQLEAHHAFVNYYGMDALRNPDTDRWQIELYDDIDQATQGMFIQCYTPVADDPLKPTLPTGTFTVAGQDATAAWSYTPGDVLLTEKTGTYLIVMINGYEQDYYCTGGTIAVTEEEGRYTIACDLTTNYNTRITGGYTGAIEVKNEYMPLVDEDLTVECDRVYQNKLNYYSFAGSYNYNFVICDTEFTEPNKPDNGGPANIVSFDLYTDVAPVDGTLAIPDGTYTLGGMRAGQLSKGFTYGIHYNEKGRQCQKITFSEGSLTVSSTEGVYRFTLDCQTNSGHRYVCNFEGVLPFGNTEKSAFAFPEKSLRGRLPRVVFEAGQPAPEAAPFAADASGRLLRQDALR